MVGVCAPVLRNRLPIYDAGWYHLVYYGAGAYPAAKAIYVELGAESMLPKTLAVSFIREIGPVIIAIICAGKVASGIGAELGSMKVTEQIDAMEVSGANPLQYLVVTRIIGHQFNGAAAYHYWRCDRPFWWLFLALNFTDDISFHYIFVNVFPLLNL
jgi:hypothetical protein